jgi:hypothetical protein
MTRIMKLIFN